MSTQQTLFAFNYKRTIIHNGQKCDVSNQSPRENPLLNCGSCSMNKAGLDVDSDCKYTNTHVCVIDLHPPENNMEVSEGSQAVVSQTVADVVDFKTLSTHFKNKLRTKET